VRNEPVSAVVKNELVCETRTKELVSAEVKNDPVSSMVRNELV
jgi:hypothetical protein